METDEIFNLLQRCSRRHYIKDLHSFIAKTEKGSVYVECTAPKGFYIESFEYDITGEEFRKHYYVSIEEAVQILKQLEIDLRTVET